MWFPDGSRKDESVPYGCYGGFAGVSSRNVLCWSCVRAHDARRDERVCRRGRVRLAIRGRRKTEEAREARRERAQALEPDREADLGDGPVGLTEQCRRALEPPAEQVCVRRLAEHPP